MLQTCQSNDGDDVVRTDDDYGEEDDHHLENDLLRLSNYVKGSGKFFSLHPWWSNFQFKFNFLSCPIFLWIFLAHSISPLGPLPLVFLLRRGKRKKMQMKTKLFQWWSHRMLHLIHRMVNGSWTSCWLFLFSFILLCYLNKFLTWWTWVLQPSSGRSLLYFTLLISPFSVSIKHHQ